jgi:hypothetical protein
MWALSTLTVLERNRRAGICSLVIYEIYADSEGLDVKRVKVGCRRLRRTRAFAPLCLLVLAACSGLPAIGNAPLVPENSPTAPVYRDLADIPDPPPVTPRAANETTIEILTQDRAKTAQAAEDLRREPFMQPDSDTKPGF